MHRPVSRLLDGESMQLRPLPAKVDDLLQQLKAPPRLIAHLTLVHDVAHKLVSEVDRAWPNLDYDRTAVLIGAATHDIGKAVKPQELLAPGKDHEEIGRELLLKAGFPAKHARFAWTHGGDTRESEPVLEDLLVRLADTIWKGVRSEALENRLCALLAARKNEQPWEVLIKLDEIICDITETADLRLSWQAKHSAEN